MEVSSIAAFASANAQIQLQQQASILLLRKALEMQEQSAALMLQALPEIPAASDSVGTVVNTWA